MKLNVVWELGNVYLLDINGENNYLLCKLIYISERELQVKEVYRLVIDCPLSEFLDKGKFTVSTLLVRGKYIINRDYVVTAIDVTNLGLHEHLEKRKIV